MFQITTRTGRTVQTDIASLDDAIHKIRILEFDAKRADIYSPGYYQIEKTNEGRTRECLCQP